MRSGEDNVQIPHLGGLPLDKPWTVPGPNSFHHLGTFEEGVVKTMCRHPILIRDDDGFYYCVRCGRVSELGALYWVRG